MRCHLRNGIYETDDFPFLIKVRPSLRDSAFSLRFPAENFRTAKFSAGKTLRKRRDGRKRDSEGENCDRRSACATRKRTVREPLSCRTPAWNHFLSGCGEGSPAPSALHMRVVCPYPRPPVLPALSLRKTAYRNGWRDTDFSGYGGTFRKKSGRRAIIWLYNNKVVFCKNNIMAITIKNIPVLEGVTAEDFVRSADKNAAKVTPRLSVEAKKRLRKVLEKSRSFRFN